MQGEDRTYYPELFYEEDGWRDEAYKQFIKDFNKEIYDENGKRRKIITFRNKQYKLKDNQQDSREKTEGLVFSDGICIDGMSYKLI